MINKFFVFFISVFLGQLASAGPIIVGHGAGESEYSILFARAHLDELLSVCSADQCHFSSLEKDWLRTTRELALLAPDAIFKTKDELGDRLFLRHPIEHQVWLNQDLLWLDPSRTVPYQVSDAVILWMNILLVGKNIPKPLLAIMQFDLAAALTDHVQSIFSTGDKTSGFTAVLWSRKAGNDDLYFRDQAFQTYSGLSSVRAALVCEAETASQIKFHSGRWMTSENQQEVSSKLALRLELSVTWNCGKWANKGRVQVTFNAIHKEVYEIDSSSIRAFAIGD